MKSFFDARERADLLARYERLAPDSRPRWGKMDAPRMLCHVTDALRMALGEVRAKPIRSPLWLAPFRWLALRVPLPKGAPTVAELLETRPAEWGEDVARFRAAAQRLADHPEDRPLGEHPLFGVMPRRACGELVWRHLDHHARQFGV